MKTVKGNEVVTVAKAKKANSKSLKAKVTANKAWKDETFSLSALVRYSKTEKAQKHLQVICDLANETNGTTITPNVLSVPNIVKYASVRELNKAVLVTPKTETAKAVYTYNGGKKTKFAYWLLILTIGRISKAKKV